MTCYRVGIRMGDPAMPSLLVAHHRPGFYLRVLEEGAVQAGDAIVKVADGPERLTVAEVDGLLYLPGQVARAARAGPAGARAQRGLEGELPRRCSPRPTPTPAPAGVARLPAVTRGRVRRESATITSFRLMPADGAPSPGARRPVPHRAPAAGRRRRRRWSQLLASDLPRARLPDQRQARGRRASRYLHEHVKVGDAIDAAAPRGSFVLRAGDPAGRADQRRRRRDPRPRDAARAAGERTTRPVWWLHGARNRDEHAFGAEVDALLGALAEAIVFGYSRPAAEAPARLRRRGPTGRRGRSNAPRSPSDADYYLCGPEGFMRAIGAALSARGVAPEHVASEAFGAVAVHASGLVKAGDRAPHTPDGPPGTGPAVTFVRSNLAVAWDDRYPSLLDLAEACDVPVGFGVPHRRLPQLRERAGRGRGHLHHGPARTAARRPGPRLLQSPCVGAVRARTCGGPRPSEGHRSRSRTAGTGPRSRPPRPRRA